MSHWPILPLLLPLVAGSLLLVLDRSSVGLRRVLGVLATFALLPVAAKLLVMASGAPQVYYLGDWPAPFGIVLVLDRLSALMLAVTAVLACASVVYATTGDDTRGPYFHALFQFQLLGVNGAFLTGDLFNLFVFFEVLLLASYCLLMHGPNPARTRAALQVVVLNLTGSALFLVALGIIYATSGTLNIADLAGRVANAPIEMQGLVRAGGLLLLVVFGLKAAIVPLGFWLPRAYSVCTASVACLFAVMTKVGVYAIIRVHLLVYGAEDPTLPGSFESLAEPWLMPLALVTIMLGTLGLLTAATLRVAVAYLVVISVGTLLAGVGLFTRDALAASLFYLVHSTLITGGLFLLADLIARQRGAADDFLDRAQKVSQPVLIGTLFFVAVIAIAGLPPMSGFITKVMLLQAGMDSTWMAWLWAVVLGSGVLTLVALSRAGSALFWRTADTRPLGLHSRLTAVAPALLLIGCSVVLVAVARPVADYTAATAEQLANRQIYVNAVLANTGVSAPASVEEKTP
jgi:multicomponent K+:H+ antiporter subunit D